MMRHYFSEKYKDMIDENLVKRFGINKFDPNYQHGKPYTLEEIASIVEPDGFHEKYLLSEVEIEQIRLIKKKKDIKLEK